MSIWCSTDDGRDNHQILREYSNTPYGKIDALSKVLVIQALDNGQCKSDVAREHGISPQMVESIYRQKETIIQKYTNKFELLKEVCHQNAEQRLLDWFEEELKSGNAVTERNLLEKAKDILKNIKEDECIDWLFTFRNRHNISKYTSDNKHSEKAKEEWKKLLKSTDCKDLYFGGMFALAHSLDHNSYLNGQQPESYVSVFFIINTLGHEKRELAVVGKETLETEIHVKSLPVTYYYCINNQINKSLLHDYLTKWDNELAAKGNSVTLVLGVPDSVLQSLHFNNIRLVSANNLVYVSSILDKIIECLKYHYRRLQISRTLTYGKDNSTFLDYMHMLGMAWYNLPNKYVQSLSFPPGDGSLYFNIKEVADCDHSISQWCKLYNIPINIEQCPSLLDKYITCENNLPCIYCGQLDASLQATEILDKKVSQSTSGMEAYQAMKRLVSYLQGENAGGPIIKYAKYIENHLEYGALLHMHQIIASTNDSIK